MPLSASAAALAVLQKEEEGKEDEDGEDATKGDEENVEEEKTRKDAAQKVGALPPSLRALLRPPARSS
jgi:hypothetical protein